jgi:hypothetical protein
MPSPTMKQIRDRFAAAVAPALMTKIVARASCHGNQIGNANSPSLKGTDRNDRGRSQYGERENEPFGEARSPTFSPIGVPFVRG